MARDEAERSVHAEILKSRQQCVDSGPICTIWGEIGKMRDVIATLKEEIARERGEMGGIMKAQARQTTILIAAISFVGVAAQIVLGLLKIHQ